MAHIKTVEVNAIAYLAMPRRGGYYWQRHTFTTFTDDNGNKTYLVNDKVVTKEDGNKKFLDIRESNRGYIRTKECKDYIRREWRAFHNGSDKKYLTLHEADTYKQEVTERDISYEEIIERLESQIDRYTQYIDSPKQQREAEERNDKISRRIQKVRELMEARK